MTPPATAMAMDKIKCHARGKGNMSRQARIAWTICSSLLLLTAGAQAADCAAGKQYFAQAQDKIAASANEDATALLHQSIDSCPNYDAYEALGELLAQSSHGRDKAKAVDALVAAHAQARTPSDRAQSLFQYAALLNREGDPQNAYPLIQKARALDPSRPAIQHLAADVEAQIEHPQSEQLTRALRYSLYKPLKVGSGKGPNGVARVADGTGPSVNIPIHFETNSTVIDEETRPNLSELAKTLADPSLAGRRFSFIGHSDARGDERYNEALSLQRAEAISKSI